MITLFGRFKQIFALLLSLVSVLLLSGPATMPPLDAAAVQLNFNIIADTHIDEIWNDGGRSGILAKGLKDMSNAAMKSDALVIAGDMTETGKINEYYKLGATLKLFCNAGNILPEMGNHDIRGIKNNKGESLLNYEFSSGKYIKFLDKTAGITTDTIFYCRIIKDCYFIVLNPEGMEGMETVLSDTQLRWLDSLLAEAAVAGNPVFIVNHQPLEAVGEDSAELSTVMHKYNGMLDIFFITGHYHNGFSMNSITNDGTLYFVDTPAFGKTNSGDYGKTGTGFHVELYKDKIVFRARDFTGGKWVPQYDRNIDLIDR